MLWAVHHVTLQTIPQGAGAAGTSVVDSTPIGAGLAPAGDPTRSAESNLASLQGHVSQSVRRRSIDEGASESDCHEVVFHMTAEDPWTAPHESTLRFGFRRRDEVPHLVCCQFLRTLLLFGCMMSAAGV